MVFIEVSSNVGQLTFSGRINGTDTIEDTKFRF